MAPYSQGDINLHDKAEVEKADRKRFAFVNDIVKEVETRNDVFCWYSAHFQVVEEGMESTSILVTTGSFGTGFVPGLIAVAVFAAIIAGLMKGNLMENITITLILIAVIGLAVWYIWKEKKKGTKCIGCPNAGCCTHKGCGGND